MDPPHFRQKNSTLHEELLDYSAIGFSNSQPSLECIRIDVADLEAVRPLVLLTQHNYLIDPEVSRAN